MWIKQLFLVLTPVKAATTLSVHTTACGASVLTVQNAAPSSLTFAPFFSPPTDRVFVYANWNTEALEWNPAEWIPSHPFVYALDMAIDPAIASTVLWTTDSFNRVMANGVYIYAAHADQPISSAPTDSTVVSDKWVLLSPDLDRRQGNCPLPSAPPSPAIPCADTNLFDESLCALFMGLNMCYCDPSDVSVSFAAMNFEVFANCQHSCGCCYGPPSAPSLPSPPPPLAPMTLEPCVLGEALPGSRCFVQVETKACLNHPGRVCLSIDRPFYAAFIKASCSSSITYNEVSTPCIDLPMFGRDADVVTHGYARFVLTIPPRTGSSFRRHCAGRPTTRQITGLWLRPFFRLERTQCLSEKTWCCR